MKYNIQKWGRLEKKNKVNPYDLGGALTGIGSVASMIPGVGGLIGAGVGMVGSIISGNKQAKEQRKAMQEQVKMQNQAQLLAMPQSGQGLVNPTAMAYGGYLSPEIIAKSGIYIKPENRGKFTATKERTGKTTEELTHSKNPLTRKRAIFAQNAKKWKHEDGGYVNANTDSYDNTPSNYLALGGPTDPPEKGLNTISSAYTPSNKTQWIPQSAALSRYKTLMGEGKSKEAENLVFGYYANEPYGPYDEGTHSEYEKKGKIKSMRAKDLLNLDTKQYKAPKDYDALMETLRPKIIDRNPGQQFTNLTIKAKGGYVNPIGADLNSLTLYGAGGTHSQNPLGGIPLGKSIQGKTNSVEQGETSFKFKEGKYVFSNRLKVKR